MDLFMYTHMVKLLCQYISSLCSLHKQLCLFIAAPVTSTVHVMRENYTAATVKDLPAPPPVENIRNKKCQVSLRVPGHVPDQVISSFFIPLEALFPDNSSISIQTKTVPCDMPAVVFLAPEEQHPEQETNVITLQLTVFMTTSSSQYTILRYIFSAVMLRKFLQYLQKHAL